MQAKRRRYWRTRGRSKPARWSKFSTQSLIAWRSRDSFIQDVFWANSNLLLLTSSQINLNSSNRSVWLIIQVCDNDAPSKEDIEESKNEVDALLSEDQDDLLGSAIDLEEALGEEGAEEMLVEEEEEAIAVIVTKSADKLKPISDKFFYKEMARIKEKSKTTGIGTLPPKKSASAYIIFQKEVSQTLYTTP